MKCQYRLEIPEFLKTKLARKFEFENAQLFYPPSSTVFVRNFKFQISKTKPPTSDCPSVVLVLGSAVCVAHKRVIFVHEGGGLVHYSAVVGSCCAPAPLLSQTRYLIGKQAVGPASCHAPDGFGVSQSAIECWGPFSLFSAFGGFSGKAPPPLKELRQIRPPGRPQRRRL